MLLKDYLAVSKTKIKKKNLGNKQLEDIIQDCRNYISQLMFDNDTINDDERTLDEIYRPKLTEYINDHYEEWGYAEDINILTNTVCDSILNFGILQDALNDKKIDEIQCNGRWLFYNNSLNKARPLLDKNTKERLYFKSPEEQYAIISKLNAFGKLGLSTQYKLINVRTPEGYRLSATDRSVNIYDPTRPEDNNYASFTLRKFRKKDFTLPQLIKLNELNEEMSDFLSLCIQSTNLFCVGRTYSGKTTLLKALLKQVEDWVRIFSIQNPVENDLRKFNSKGELVNNVLVLEAQDSTEKGRVNTYVNTVANLIIHALRNSPDMISVNEVRNAEEFYNLCLAGQLGHTINSSYHAGSSYEAITIAANRVKEITQQTDDGARRDVCNNFDIIVVMEILGDEKKITHIDEILGIDKDGEPIINPIYEFQIGEKIESGQNFRYTGEFIKVGKISERLRHKLLYAGVDKHIIEKY